MLQTDQVRTLMLVLTVLLMSIVTGEAQTPFVFPFDSTARWEYDIFNNMIPWDFQHVAIRLGRDTLMQNNKTYKPFGYSSRAVFFFRREGSKVIQYEPSMDSSEFVRYDFSKKMGEVVDVIRRRFDSSVVFVNDDRMQNVFDTPRRSITVHSTNGEVWDTLVDSIGILAFSPVIDIAYTMTGALIGGRIFGSITHVASSNSEALSSPRLWQNYPNPFNPSTLIQFELSSPSIVTLTVTNLLGQRVATLVNEGLQAGRSIVHWDASSFPTGAYYYTLQIGGFRHTRRMLVLR
jgi:hypothetical protein